MQPATITRLLCWASLDGDGCLGWSTTMVLVGVFQPRDGAAEWGARTANATPRLRRRQVVVKPTTMASPCSDRLESPPARRTPACERYAAFGFLPGAGADTYPDTRHCHASIVLLPS